ncbi:hypothetical protein A3Q56_02959 [Intoshia linei]|uniref:receptor protein serine/threonine kinase n=1 Tax=Intoshia linei TaxID=1819745 RepID=A0A177B4S8_9BILA|nr:hypothetical protein A3Q56_02959 [Intoshia linei]
MLISITLLQLLVKLVYINGKSNDKKIYSKGEVGNQINPEKNPLKNCCTLDISYNVSYNDLNNSYPFTINCTLFMILGSNVELSRIIMSPSFAMCLDNPDLNNFVDGYFNSSIDRSKNIPIGLNEFCCKISKKKFGTNLQIPISNEISRVIVDTFKSVRLNSTKYSLPNQVVVITQVYRFSKYLPIPHLNEGENTFSCSAIFISKNHYLMEQSLSAVLQFQNNCKYLNDIRQGEWNFNSPKVLKCYCSNCLNENSCNIKKGDVCYVSVVHTSHQNLTWKYGCVTKDKALMTCTIHSHTKIAVECCDSRDLCNFNLIPKHDHILKNIQDSIHHQNQKFLFIIPSALLFILFIILISYYFWRQKYNTSKSNKSTCKSMQSDVEISENYGLSRDSVSGIRLDQKTVCKQVTLEKIIGKGRFGDVWLADWRGAQIAVKTFSSINETSWSREVDIFNTAFINHNNILSNHTMPVSSNLFTAVQKYINDFYGSDIKGNGTTTHMWLLTDYHKNGSLYDFLQTNSFNETELVKAILSISSGIVHLHEKILGCYKLKPSIVHRDLKSKNILVKDNLSCCIADFGHAISSNDFYPDSIIIQKGTKRYMAPEILDESIDKTNFNEFKMSDIYSLSLVFWEMCVRTSNYSSTPNYKLPFSEDIGNDPSIEEMKHVVLTLKKRPLSYKIWNTSRLMMDIYRMISECWAENPVERLTSMYIHKYLSKMDTMLNMRKNFTCDALTLYNRNLLSS